MLPEKAYKEFQVIYEKNFNKKITYQRIIDIFFLDHFSGKINSFY